MKRSLSFAPVITAVVFCGLAFSVSGQVTTQSLLFPPAARLFPQPPTPAAPAPVPAPLVIPANPVPVAPGPMPPNVIVWDSELKEYKAKVGEQAAQFLFNLTNVSPDEVTITDVRASCGCTTAQLPPMPWKLTAGTNGQIPVRMNLTGIPGTYIKTITVNTDKGWKMLTVKSIIEPGPAVAMTAADREKNQSMAKADRQAVFRGDCARCHVQPVIGKVGKDLYASACGICHEAEHRATVVPDLHALKHETNAEYWKTWIANGKVGSLMPAFSQGNGGPLSDPQIATLVDYLVTAIPSKPGAPPILPHQAAH